MSFIYGHEWASAARNQYAELDQADRYTSELLVKHDQRRYEVHAQANHALSELVATLLPVLTREHLAHAAGLTGYTPLVSGQPLERMAAEADDLARKIQVIEADPNFIHREHLRDPRGGKLILELAELDGARRSIEPLVAAAAHPRLPHLLAVGYGTPAYDVPFWRLSYYTDWEAADEILVNFPGKTFSEFRDEYQRSVESLESLAQRAKEIDQLLRKGAEQDRRYATLRHAQETLAERTLSNLREHLGRHIVDSGGAAIGPRLAQVPELDILAKRVFGLGAKLDYLDGLRQSELVTLQREIAEGKARAQREAEKYARSKNAYAAIPVEKYQQRFRPIQERYQKRWHRYQHTSDTVYVFDRYDRGSFVQDFLWWDLMTDGRIDGDFIPQVASHHHQHPNYQYARDDYHDDAARAVHIADPYPSDSHESAGFMDPS
jgi:hypothetical protein